MGAGRAQGGGGDYRHPVSMGFVARAALVVLGLCALIVLFWLGREILFVGFFGVIFALFLSIFVDPLVRRGVPRVLATVLVVLALIGLAVLIVWLIRPTLSEQIVLVRLQLPSAFQDVITWIQNQFAAITGGAGVQSEQVTRDLQLRAERLLGRIVAGAIPLLQTISGVVVGALLIFVTGIYLCVDPKTYVRGLVSLVPHEGRDRFESALYDVGHDLRRWILGTVINMIIIGVLTTAGLLFLGIPAPLVLGLIALLLEFIPFYGPILSAVPAVAVALLTSTESALWVIILYVVIQQGEGHLLQPLVMRGTVRLPPVLTVLIGAFMTILFGFLGLVLAVPLLATALAMIKRLYVQPLNAHALRVAKAPPDTPLTGYE
jgi:predicted PurR-regulated permease PerM